MKTKEPKLKKFVEKWNRRNNKIEKGKKQELLHIITIK